MLLLFRLPRALKNISTINCCSLSSPHTSTRQKSSDNRPTNYVVEPTTMKMEKFDPKTHSVKGIPPVVTGYTTKGFRVQGNRVFGSIALLQQGFYSWRPTRANEITVESLQLFTVTDPRIEILVLGMGDRSEPLSTQVKDYLRGHSIGVEISDTPRAVSMFNLLLEEGRIVAGALIPPAYISPI